MWTSVSISRWMCLLSLAAVMFLSISQVDSNNPYVALDCCKKLSEKGFRRIAKCFEQEPRPNCNIHAFLIINKRGRMQCINATSQWINAKIDKFTKLSEEERRTNRGDVLQCFISYFSDVNMLNAGMLLKSALVAVILGAVVEAGPMQKLASCCKTVNKLEIKEPVKGYLVQEAKAPCVKAIIFQTQTGLYCSPVNAVWVFNKIREFRKAKAASAAPSVVTASPVSLLSIITSSTSPPSSSLVSSSSSPPSSSSSASTMPFTKHSEEERRRRTNRGDVLQCFISHLSDVKMLNAGMLLKSALVAVILGAAVEAGPIEKPSDCCMTVNKLEIKEPVLGYLVQKAHPPCVKAVIFQTQTGLYCSPVNAVWVFNKIREFRKAKAASAAPSVVTASPVSLLSIITSTTSPPSSSLVSSSSSPPSSSSSASTMPVGESFSESKDKKDFVSNTARR
ncbi:uncharacterized protein FYW49_016634 [Xenentodon cancila]